MPEGVQTWRFLMVSWEILQNSTPPFLGNFRLHPHFKPLRSRNFRLHFWKTCYVSNYAFESNIYIESNFIMSYFNHFFQYRFHRVMNGIHSVTCWSCSIIQFYTTLCVLNSDLSWAQRNVPSSEGALVKDMTI